MNRKYLKMMSLTLQGIYSAFCILDIVICIVYHYNFNTLWGRECAYFALKLTGVLFLVPAMPLGVIFNILALPKKQSERAGRRRWLIWTICSPFIYMLFFFAAVCTLIATTGGV